MYYFSFFFFSIIIYFMCIDFISMGAQVHVRKWEHKIEKWHWIIIVEETLPIPRDKMNKSPNSWSSGTESSVLTLEGSHCSVLY